MLNKILSVFLNFLSTVKSWILSIGKDKQELEYLKTALKNRDAKISQQKTDLSCKNREIELLKETLEKTTGKYQIINGKRQYDHDEDQNQFYQRKHRDLSVIVFDELKAVGLSPRRTKNNDPKGDIKYTTTSSEEDKAKLKLAFENLAAKRDEFIKSQKK